MRIESPEDRILGIIADHIQYNGSGAVNLFEITNGFNEEGTYMNDMNLNEAKSKKVTFTINLFRKGGTGYKTIFVPTVILWTLAYLTLFLDVDDFTNRNRISVTVLLCLTTLFGALSIKQDFPRTTEFKYVDFWFLWYLTNAFLINCHHLMIDKLSRKSKSNVLLVKKLSVERINEDIFSIIKEIWKYPSIINHIGTAFFFVGNLSFNIVYLSIAT